MKKNSLTLVLLPCLTGAPWNLNYFNGLKKGFNLLPISFLELTKGSIKDYAKFVQQKIASAIVDEYIILGDSFGAIVGLAIATQRPSGLKGLVLSGGFAQSPPLSLLSQIKLMAAPFAPYELVTLRLHAQSLASPFDGKGEVRWSEQLTYELFLKSTPRSAYFNRLEAIFSADYSDKLPLINVPTLILTPSDDRLIGSEAAQQMLENIPKAQEVVIPNTGHMFRFSHPISYEREILKFLDNLGFKA